MFNRLLDTFANNPEYRAFLLDGQVIALEDFLQECPEKEPLVRRYVSEGRLQIGPWYNLPDEYPVSGEALVRNLLIGIRKAQALGGVLKLGYTSFGWGQTAQLPQIYAGFGIDFVVLGKHVSKKRAPHSEFIWQSPDGSRVLSTRLGKGGRSNFYFEVVLPLAYGQNYFAKSWGFRWPGSGAVYHAANPDRAFREYYLKPVVSYHSELLYKCLAQLWQTTDDTLVPDCRFAGDGCDYSGPTELLPRILKDANEAKQGQQLVHASISEYAEKLKVALKDKTLNVVEGELRDGPIAACTGNALATRMPLKALNRRAQETLIHYAEPWGVLGKLLGMDYAANFVHRAWLYLLQAQAHDAINGVTLDKTAEDVAYRLNQVIELSDVAFEHTAAQIMKQMDLKTCRPDDILLAVFNPLPRPVDRVVEAVVDVPFETDAKWLEAEEVNGVRQTTQPVDRTELQVPICVEDSRALPYHCDRHRLYLHTGEIPALGYKVLRLRPGQTFNRTAHFWPEDQDFGSQIIGPNRMANRFLEVQVNPDGTFEVLCKATGLIFRQLGYFEDSGEAGDYWQRVTPMHEKVITSLGQPARVAIVQDGPLVTRFECEQTLVVPSHLDRQRSVRCAETTLLKIRNAITLRVNRPFVEVSVTVENTARDHRLRVCLPTYLNASHSDAEGHFFVDRRPIVRTRDKRGLRDAHMGTLPQQHFVGVSHAGKGLAVLNRNLTEYEVSDDTSRTIFLTLLRSVQVRLCAEFRCAQEAPEQMGSQCLGHHQFDYAVYPHTGNWLEADVYGQMEEFVYEPRLYQCSMPAAGRISPQLSLLEVSPAALQLAAVKPAENDEGIVVRLFNPTAATINGTLSFVKRPQRAQRINLNEDFIGELPLDGDGRVLVSAEAFKIVSVHCVFAAGS
jgi:mannosylglycerate hydrolase